jgi:hypothetical protein
MHSPDLEAAFEEGILDTEISLDGRERLLAVEPSVLPCGAAFVTNFVTRTLVPPLLT